jgi:hypothetical protein
VVAHSCEGIAQLLTSWINDGSPISRKELTLLILETVRDDIVQAVTIDGRRVTDPQTMRDYLNDLTIELRKLTRGSKAAD